MYVVYTHKPLHHTHCAPGHGFQTVHVVTDQCYGEQQVVRGRGGVEGAELGVWQVADGGGAGQRVIGYPQGHRAAEGVAVCRQALELQRLLRGQRSVGHKNHPACECVCSDGYLDIS